MERFGMLSSVATISELKHANVFELQTATGSKQFARQDIGLSQIFKLIVSTSEKRLQNTYVVV